MTANTTIGSIHEQDYKQREDLNAPKPFHDETATSGTTPRETRLQPGTGAAAATGAFVDWLVA
jgi:hypothetical protein